MLLHIKWERHGVSYRKLQQKEIVSVFRHIPSKLRTWGWIKRPLKHSLRCKYQKTIARVEENEASTRNEPDNMKLEAGNEFKKMTCSGILATWFPRTYSLSSFGSCTENVDDLKFIYFALNLKLEKISWPVTKQLLGHWSHIFLEVCWNYEQYCHAHTNHTTVLRRQFLDQNFHNMPVDHSFILILSPIQSKKLSKPQWFYEH